MSCPIKHGVLTTHVPPPLQTTHAQLHLLLNVLVMHVIALQVVSLEAIHGPTTALRLIKRASLPFQAVVQLLSVLQPAFMLPSQQHIHNLGHCLQNAFATARALSH
jgi:hypothetical protein